MLSISKNEIKDDTASEIENKKQLHLRHLATNIEEKVSRMPSMCKENSRKFFYEIH